jgi:hypothetical protein
MRLLTFSRVSYAEKDQNCPQSEESQKPRSRNEVMNFRFKTAACRIRKIVSRGNWKRLGTEEKKTAPKKTCVQVVRGFLSNRPP